MLCHQRKIRNERASMEGCALDNYTLSECKVEQISRTQAKDIIMKYEWLQSMPQVGIAYYGLLTPDNRIIGAVCFGKGPSPQARQFLKEGDNDDDNTSAKIDKKVVCLERGACAPITSRGSSHADNAASYLISRACRQAKKDHGWEAFFAYSDQQAGEIGTVYQACNWLYIGKGVNRSGGRTEYFDPDGNRVTSRRMRAIMKRAGYDGTLKTYYPEVLEPAGWTRGKSEDKHKYILLLNRRLRLKYGTEPYPKRPQSVGACVADWRGLDYPRFRKLPEDEPKTKPKRITTFAEYDKANPQIYRYFKRFAWEAKNRGYKHYSAKGIFERMRWHLNVETTGDPFKLNNNYTRDYSRKLVAEHPEFEGFFRMRNSQGLDE